MTLFSGRNMDSESDDEDDEDQDRERNLKGSTSRKSLTRKESRDEKEAESDGEGQEENVAEYELCDATVKLLRLFANLSINEAIGYSLAKRKDSAKVYFQISQLCCLILTLQMLLELLSVSEIGDDHEELQLNVVAACTNLTFYSCRGVSVMSS
jgi:hypothetical protein